MSVIRQYFPCEIRFSRVFDLWLRLSMWRKEEKLPVKARPSYVELWQNVLFPDREGIQGADEELLGQQHGLFHAYKKEIFVESGVKWLVRLCGDFCQGTNDRTSTVMFATTKFATFSSIVHVFHHQINHGTDISDLWMLTVGWWLQVSLDCDVTPLNVRIIFSEQSHHGKRNGVCSVRFQRILQIST